MHQAEDRAHHNGQRRDVIVIEPIDPETIDDQVMGLLDSKTELEQEIVERAVVARMCRKNHEPVCKGIILGAN